MAAQRTTRMYNFTYCRIFVRKEMSIEDFFGLTQDNISLFTV